MATYMPCVWIRDNVVCVVAFCSVGFYDKNRAMSEEKVQCLKRKLKTTADQLLITRQKLNASEARVRYLLTIQNRCVVVFIFFSLSFVALLESVFIVICSSL